MNSFNKRAAIRIGAVSVVLALIASPLAWFGARENAEERTVSLAMEESRRLLSHFRTTGSGRGSVGEHAEEAAETIIGGLFDIAEIYDDEGQKMAKAATADGKAVEGLLPGHQPPRFDKPYYESLKLLGGKWALRIFVPLSDDESRRITGYFEGVRVVPAWQEADILNDALVAALMTGLASLLCGAAIYPLVVHLSMENDRKARQVLDSQIWIMEAMGRAIAKRDSDTGAHNYRVAWIAARIGEAMGLGREQMQSLIAGSFLHDVGKIGIPDAILLKPGRLDDREMAIMRTHVAQGEEIVTGMGWLEEAQDVVAGHHEKWNGTGYPRGLAGEEISLAARIFAVADVFDALCSKRPYKEALSFEAAMRILEEETGRHFDPSVIAAFRPMARELNDQLVNCDEERTRQLLHGRVRHHFET